MSMRETFNFLGGLDPYRGGHDPQFAPMVDKMIGTAFPIVKYVAENMDAVRYLAENLATSVNEVTTEAAAAAASAVTATTEAGVASTAAAAAIGRLGGPSSVNLPPQCSAG